MKVSKLVLENEDKELLLRDRKGAYAKLRNELDNKLAKLMGWGSRANVIWTVLVNRKLANSNRPSRYEP